MTKQVKEDTPIPEYGSDLMVDILKEYGIEFVSCNPGATFRGLHDSVVNYSGNSNPELIVCCHEEISVAIAHGYAKATNKMMAVFVHSNVGLQHAAMAIFNAWCDRVPMLVIGGVGPLATSERRPWIDWIHTSNNQAGIIRDYVKWDDQPFNLASVPESLQRAYKIANTDPKAPVYVGIDSTLQEQTITVPVKAEDLAIPVIPAPPQANNVVLKQVAELLTKAKNPVIITDYTGRNPEAGSSLINLAELLNVPVIDCGARYNFPNNHALCLTGVKKQFFDQVDLVLALDVHDLSGVFLELNNEAKEYENRLNPEATVVHITMADYLISKWAADYQKLYPVDIPIAGDTAVVLPELNRLCASLITAEDSARYQQRGVAIEAKHEALRQQWHAIADADMKKQPLTVPAVAKQIWQAIASEDWVLVNNGGVGIGKWLKQIWDFDREGCYLGESGGAGLGYGIGASVGAALAYRDSDKICIDIQSDGDLLFSPSALWTLSQHKIPLLIIVMNNRSYGNTKWHSQQVAEYRQRDVANADIGSSLAEPPVDIPAMAESFGVKAFKSISNIEEIPAKVEAAIAMIKRERCSVLLDIIIE